MDHDGIKRPLAVALLLSCSATQAALSDAGGDARQAIQHIYQQQNQEMISPAGPESCRHALHMPEFNTLLVLTESGVDLRSLDAVPTPGIMQFSLQGDRATVVYGQRLDMTTSSRQTKKTTSYTVSGIYRDSWVKRRVLFRGRPEGQPIWQMDESVTLSSKTSKKTRA